MTFNLVNACGVAEGRVAAHKMPLAIGSPVFRKSFYGSDNQDNFAAVVDIKETTLITCQTMINLIYMQRSVAGVLQALSYDCLFEVFNLLQKYEFYYAKSAYVAFISSLDIPKHAALGLWLPVCEKLLLENPRCRGLVDVALSSSLSCFGRRIILVASAVAFLLHVSACASQAHLRGLRAVLFAAVLSSHGHGNQR